MPLFAPLPTYQTSLLQTQSATTPAAPASGSPRMKAVPRRTGKVQHHLVRLREINGDVVVSRVHARAPPSYCAVLEVGSTNLLLRSEEEQEALLEGFRALLKALTFPLQILVRSQPLDLSAYLARLSKVATDTSYPITWRELAEAQRTFAQELAARRTLIEHRFYLVVPAQVSPASSRRLLHYCSRSRHPSSSSAAQHHTWQQRTDRYVEQVEEARRQLEMRTTMLLHHLSTMGLSCHRLAGTELATLFFQSLTPERARRFPLSPALFAACGRLPCARSGHSSAAQGPQDRPLPVGDGERHESCPNKDTDCLADVFPLADLLAPAWAEETPETFCLEGEYTCCLAVTAVPREVSVGWLAPLLQADEPVDLVLYVHPQDSAQVIRRLLRRKAEFRSSRTLNRQRGRADHPETAVAEADIDGLMGKLASGEERVFATSLYVLVRATERQQLQERTQRMMSVLHNSLLVAHPTTFEQRRAYLACFPLAHNDLMRTFTLDSTSLSTMFPFLSQSLSMPGGVLEGVSSTGEPVMIDDWDESLDNPHRFIGAITGAGKSYYAKLKILRELIVRADQGFQVAVIDPEQEYRDLCQTLSGDYIQLAPGSTQHLNFFDLLSAGMSLDMYLADRTRGDRLAEKVQNLHALFDLMLADRGPEGAVSLSSREKGLLDRALYETYHRAGITADPATHHRPVPLLRDLYQVLVDGSGGKDTYGLADRLYRYVEGSLAGIFTAPTDVELTNRLVVFDIRAMSGELRPIAIFLIADFMWTQVLTSHQPRALYIDEAWSLIQYPEGGRFLADLARRARKHYLRLVTITQNPELFVDDPWGSVVASNVATKVLKKQDRTSAEAVTRRFQLTAGERQRLLTLNKPEALLLVGGQRVVVQIEAHPREHQIATTDPREVAQRRTNHQE
jgi:hypothetical protein